MPKALRQDEATYIFNLSPGSRCISKVRESFVIEIENKHHKATSKID